MKIISMMPFLDEASKDELVEQILNKEVDLKGATTAIYPFLNTNQLNRLFKAALDKTIDLDYTTMLPFLNDEAMDYFIKKAEASNWDTVEIEHVLPFLNKEKIQELFKETLKHYKEKSESIKEE
ncbi:MAG: hypothetical protein ACOCUE_03220 [Candidatus Izemoplasmataceae bacterium]